MGLASVAWGDWSFAALVLQRVYGVCGLLVCYFQVVLETEVTNRAALCLYENLGFVRDKYLHQYYLNGVDAYRLKLWLRDPLDTPFT